MQNTNYPNYPGLQTPNYDMKSANINVLNTRFVMESKMDQFNICVNFISMRFSRSKIIFSILVYWKPMFMYIVVNVSPWCITLLVKNIDRLEEFSVRFICVLIGPHPQLPSWIGWLWDLIILTLAHSLTGDGDTSPALSGKANIFNLKYSTMTPLCYWVWHAVAELISLQPLPLNIFTSWWS